MEVILKGHHKIWTVISESVEFRSLTHHEVAYPALESEEIQTFTKKK